MAASAGGVEALIQVVSGLPEDLNAVVLVCLHVAPIGPSVLPSILSRHGKLPAEHPNDGEVLRPGRIYVAPPDHHLVVRGRRAHVYAGPRENGNRPSADPLLRSVARYYGRRAAGVILSGALDDGTVGLAAVKHAGGLTVAQDPEEAAFPGMPLHAVNFVEPQHVAKLAEIPEILVNFVHKASLLSPYERGTIAHREEVAAMDGPSDITCPDCGGTLWVTHEMPMRFQCRVGHAFSPQSLQIGKQDELEKAIWGAIVALEERADLARRLLKHVGFGQPGLTQHYEREIQLSEERVTILKELIEELIEPIEPIDDLTDAHEDTDGHDGE